MPDPREFPLKRANDDGADVASVSTLIIAATDQRGDLELINDGAYNVWLGRGNAAVADTCTVNFRYHAH